MPKALRVCPCLGCTAHDGSCPELTPGGKCAPCRKAADVRRGTAADRGYGAAHRNGFRQAVLTDQPICVCTDATHGHGARCYAQSTVADHYPRTRRELVRLGLNPNAKEYGRGLCKGCHDKHTAATSPGGWAAGR